LGTNDLLHPHPPRAVPPSLLALLLQLAAWLPALLLIRLGVPALLAVPAQGLLAMLLSRLLGMPGWWQLINLMFSPLAWLAWASQIDARWYLTGFVLLVATSLGSLRTRVPLYLSSDQAMAEIAARLPARHGIRVMDLGCGLGGLLTGLAAERDDVELCGVEMAPLNWLVSKLRLRSRADIRFGSLWQCDLSGYDVVYAYLSPAPMPRLWQKAKQEMQPGSLFISNSFAVPGVEPDETVELDDLNHSRLLIWRL
jgi:hypothetical protein